MNFDDRRYRPMGTADLFDEAFDLYKKNFILFLGAAALSFVPLQLFLSIYNYGANESFLAEFVQAAGSLDMGRALEVIWEYLQKSYVVVPIYFIVFSLMTGALTAAVSARYLNRPMTIFGAYRAAISRWLPLLTSMAIYDISIAICFMVCMAPAVFPAVIFLFTPQAAIVEGKAGFRALSRAKQLLSGNGGRVFVALLLLGALYAAVTFAIEAPLSLFADKLVTSSLPLLPALATHQQLADQIASQLTGLLVLPFVASVVTVLYYDLRIRKEGFDMDVLAASLGYPPVELATVRPFGGAKATVRPQRINLPAGGRGRR